MPSRLMCDPCLHVRELKWAWIRTLSLHSAAVGMLGRSRWSAEAPRRQVVIRVPKPALPCRFPPARKIQFDYEGLSAMTDISTPTTLAQLVARSRKLGADRAICNWGGGNTSAKADEIDFRGRPVRILWVKGSGSDLAACTEASFTGLFLDDVLPLLDRERMSDTEMVNYLAHCFSEPGRPRPSIETLLHGFLPFTHIDHTHADATNYFACAANGEKLARECFGDDLIWIPYRRPGFGLAREVALAVMARPDVKPVILANRGLVNWGETDEACLASTLADINRARNYVEARIARADRAVFGGPSTTIVAAEERRTIAAQ